MLKKLTDFFTWSKPWRNQFGEIRGLRLALTLRKAIWASPRNSLVTINIPGLPHPLRLRAGTSDADVLFQVFQDQQAHFPVPTEPRVIVDAGANIGLTSIVFASQFPSAQILALEIDRDNFSLLSENTSQYPNITPLLKGLWARRTIITIENPDADSWGFRAAESDAGHPMSIEALGVRDILSEFSFPRIDLLKIDIEGGEYEVFKEGVEDWIDSIGMIAVEVHERFRPGCHEVIRQALKPYGFVESQWSEYSLFTRKEGVALQ